jgi:hypothetical protein
MATLYMAQVVNVRAVRRDEARARGIPTPPEGVGTEILEVQFTSEPPQFIGVEGVAGRQNWITAIW